ncbi:glycosyltransferase [Ulvibacter antarcticus]|uniref:Glycosyltransferase involved in cell wall biosynthesis n=1 Tax=Ulvibacter antarcticus TaxID=442714 RepID=A0A3L9YVK6_9FLAO|nr:glycosyltransferase [Ulvibacter antarcticus]RMA58502.1 glycosyltransferase involved in cell wall biosynthesis [Ulvibacter antarcticus]
MKKLLVIGHTFPEPSTTAAGGRMMQILSLFSEDKFKITFVSTARASERTVDLSMLGIQTEKVVLNSDSFDVFVSQLKPTVVLFDRYITEEQFGWRVAEHCPDALRILDTEDLHFLRKARQEAIKNNKDVAEANLFSETAKRELASILRSDLSLIISEVEMELLQDTFRVPKEILHYLPLWVETSSEEKTHRELPFEERRDFYTIGNLFHAPNVDAVLFLKKEIWPLIRKQLPDAQIHIYGEYAPQRIKELHAEKEGFLIKGWVEDASQVVSNAKVCLAPLRFGAGLKGKLLQAMTYGTPSVTTPIGAEGINGQYPYGGSIAESVPDFVEASVSLYMQKENWLKAQQNGYEIVRQRFQKESFSEAFKEKIKSLLLTINQHRKAHFLGQILVHQSLQSTKYMSKWISLKEQINTEKRG